jgi:hypothetical protein
MQKSSQSFQSHKSQFPAFVGVPQPMQQPITRKKKHAGHQQKRSLK